MRCFRCEEEKEKEFYANDKTCKDCRKARVKKNRTEKAEYYRAYDKKRFKEDPRVKERHKKYQATEAGKESIDKAKKKWAESNPVKRGANVMVGNAVRDGIIKKGACCEICKCNPTRLHGHHDDYAYPLDVRWLCPKCHKQWHAKNGEGKNAQ